MFQIRSRLPGRPDGALRRLVVVALSALGCAAPPLTLDLMPAPDVYADAAVDPFADTAPVESLPDFSLLYATLREPAGEGDRERFYTNERGRALRAGVARVEVGRENLDWEEARRISLAKNRPHRYPLEVSRVREIGVIESSIFTPVPLRRSEAEAVEEFASQVNERLAASRVKDVYVYVHGYKVVFENPLLVASELWHFLGYEGVMIAFAWPSTPSPWAYFSDLETALWSAQGFRRLLSLLAERTDARRVHVLGYSAGTRLVAQALGQIALMHGRLRGEAPRSRTRLGDVVLVGSDVDRGLMGLYIEDGLLGVQERLTIYLSDADKALAWARRVLGGRRRIGESFAEGLSEEASKLLRSTQALHLVDVTEAEASNTGNGHAYFRRSPWASSDVLITLATDLGPGERGLVRDEGSVVWRFPSDYVDRLRRALQEILAGSPAERP